MRRSATIWFTVTVVLPMSIRAGTIRHDRDVEVHEAVAADRALECVCRLLDEGQADERERTQGSGVLVAPQWILTAAHVAEVIDMDSTDQHWIVGGARYRSVRVVFHPQWSIEDRKRGGRTWRRDLALIKLDRQVRDVEPAVRYRSRDELNQIVTIVGYGAVGTGHVALLPEYGHRKLAGRNAIDAVGGIATFIRDEAVQEHLMLIDLDGPDDQGRNDLGDATPLDLEMCSNGGDSGGGAFVQNDRGEWRLVGIISGGRVSGSDTWRKEHSDWEQVYTHRLYGHIDALERVSTANEWIDRVLHGK